ncbi:hypothetical protein L207DRAFT_179831 [Hyaloscypha variabilis F]|uniref:Uncharacterized protein n=1 Tax=Hyaloscypha variabilis (strain UAMH 11265 / GT02V1 / F) TaxID=1149755 RepID=A0A2J6R176_HYAVF|nr:hypothetical protein L207DRAFT_179831 [Hyaloscypha variabilis F]
MIQSPLMPNIAILFASFAQGIERGEDVNRRQETLALKVKALALTNEFLAEDFGLIGNDAMLAIIHLAGLEYIWGHEQSILSHLRGLKEMVRLKRGFAGLTDRITAWVIIMLDFEVAIRYERELCVLPPELIALMSKASSTIAPPPAFLSPLQSLPGAFAQSEESMSHSIVTSTAEILDDISLVSAITSSPPSPTSKIRGTASWLHSRFQYIDVKPTTDAQIILCIIKLTAIVYSNSISTLTPLSLSFNQNLLAELYSYFTFF